MNHKMYVGNLPFTASEADLRSIFSEYGQPQEVVLVMDRESGRSKGFGFVSMTSREAMEAAILGENGRDLNGRKMTVNEAREREPRPAGGSSRG